MEKEHFDKSRIDKIITDYLMLNNEHLENDFNITELKRNIETIIDKYKNDTRNLQYILESDLRLSSDYGENGVNIIENVNGIVVYEEKKRFYHDYYLIKGTYNYGGRIYLGLENEEERYCDITINIPNVMLEDNCIIISSDLSEKLVEELEDLGLFEVINVIPYNYGKYKIALLNTDMVEKYAIELE